MPSMGTGLAERNAGESGAGWALRTAREHAAEAGVRTRSGMAAGGGVVPPVHAAQVGRWESGATAVTPAIVQRYETVLQLTPGHLQALISQADEVRGTERSVGAPTFGTDRHALMSLAERARSGDPMTGHDWVELAARFERTVDLCIFDDDWTAIVARCVREMDVSAGVEYDLRCEAAAGLAAHWRSAEILPRWVDSALREPGRQVYAETACLLQFCRGPATTDVLFDHLARPTNPSLWRWAAAGLVAHAKRQELPADWPQRVGGHCWQVLSDESAPRAVRLAAGALLHHAGLGQSILMRHRRLADSEFGRVLWTGHTRQPHSSLPTAHQVALRTAALTGVESPDTTFLADLLRSVDTVQAQSLGSVFATLRLSPYADAIADIHLERGRAAIDADDAGAAVDALSIVSMLSSARTAPALVDLLSLRADVAPEVVEALGLAIGNSTAAPSAELDRRVAEFARGHADAPAAVRGLGYALGMRGRTDLLTELETADPRWSETAAWWKAR